MEGRGLEVKEGEFALKCRIAFHVKSALCCPLAPAPYPCSLRARQVLYLPGGGWSPLSGLVGMCVCSLCVGGGLQTFVCRFGWRPGFGGVGLLGRLGSGGAQRALCLLPEILTEPSPSQLWRPLQGVSRSPYP